MICVLGQTGQVARALTSVWGSSPLSRTHELATLGREEADFTKPGAVSAALERLRPTAVINAAAYTAVDRAEKEPEIAFQVNAQAVAEIARFCAKSATPLIHYSTDYVYSGGGFEPHLETEPMAPISVYGQSKAQGEREIEKAGAPEALIFRTSWVYHELGQNFVRTMLRLGAEREELSVVSDQIGSPTSALVIARSTYQALERQLKPGFGDGGVYHLAGQGETSWYGFATAIFRQAKELGMVLRVQNVHPITTAQYPTPAKRPLNSRLSQNKLKRVFGLELPHWSESLGECLQLILIRDHRGAE